MPPIVSEELFNRVQEIMARNQKAPAMRKAEDDYILTARLFCGKCGTFMVGESRKAIREPFIAIISAPTPNARWGATKSL